MLIGTVGVAPGTTTLQLGEVYPGVSAKSINWIKPYPCPPEEKRWFMPDRDDPRVSQPAHPTGFRGLHAAGSHVRFFDPYANDIFRLRGLRGPIAEDKNHVRWELVAVIGGGAVAIALLTSFIASILPRRFGV